jgi:hypothetical protein
LSTAFALSRLVRSEHLAGLRENDGFKGGSALVRVTNRLPPVRTSRR